MDKGINISFSKIEYSDIAPAVGLKPILAFYDAPLFDLRRSRIPTSLFKKIVEDIDASLIHYGALTASLGEGQPTEEARSRILVPIFSHLVAQFDGAIHNRTESFMSGRITRDRVDYHFKTIFFITVVFLEVQLPSGSPKDHLKAIAQVIEECEACYDKNYTKRPIYSILYDGKSFRFFIFDGSTKPYKFSRGTFPSERHFEIQQGLKLVDFFSKATAHSFVHSLRPICETIFNIFLVTYVATLKAYRDQSIAKPSPRGWFVSPVPWEAALKFAEEALEKSQDAEVQRQINSINEADATTRSAITALKFSLDAAPPDFKGQSLMDTWDDDELAKV